MARGESFVKKAKCKHAHRSTMSNSAWSDLNKNCTVLKLHEMCHNPECNCPKQINFSPRKFQLEGNGFKKTMEKTFKGFQTSWNRFLKPAVNIAVPFIGMAAGAKTKNPKVVQATTNILKSTSGGKILSLTNLHGNGLRLKVM